VQRIVTAQPMSLLGQKRRNEAIDVESAPGPEADIARAFYELAPSQTKKEKPPESRRLFSLPSQ
jgi:hypothetical protein